MFPGGPLPLVRKIVAPSVLGVIRVGDSNIGALRVGIALANGGSLASVKVRRGKLQHKGRASKHECVNPAHYTREASDAQGQ